MARRDNGAGSIEARGTDKWRLRYRIGSDRFTKTVKGSKGDAVKELRSLLKAADDGEHVAPDKMAPGLIIGSASAHRARARRKSDAGRSNATSS